MKKSKSKIKESKYEMSKNFEIKMHQKPNSRSGLPFVQSFEIAMHDGHKYEMPFGESLYEETKTKLEKSKKEAFGLLLEESLECMEYTDPEEMIKDFGSHLSEHEADYAIKENCKTKGVLNKLGFNDIDIKHLAKKYPYPDLPESVKKRR